MQKSRYTLSSPYLVALKLNRSPDRICGHAVFTVKFACKLPDSLNISYQEMLTLY